jgi:hypothetical protein
MEGSQDLTVPMGADMESSTTNWIHNVSSIEWDVGIMEHTAGGWFPVGTSIRVEEPGILNGILRKQAVVATGRRRMLSRPWLDVIARMPPTSMCIKSMNASVAQMKQIPTPGLCA